MTTTIGSDRSYVDSIRPRGWDYRLWRATYEAAQSMSKEALLTFMSTRIHGLEKFTKDEMIDILPEVGISAARELINGRITCDDTDNQR